MVRRIEHTVLVVLWGLMFWVAGYFFSSIIFYIFLLPMVFLVICDAVFPILINKSLKVDIQLQRPQGYRYQQNKIIIQTYHPTFLFSSIGLMTLEIKNSFTGEVTEQTFAFPIYGRKKQVLEIPISLESCGKYCFSVKKIEVEGILGICKSRSKAKEKRLTPKAYLYCFPENLLINPMEEKKRNSRQDDGMEDLDDSHGIGMDSSEVSGIRAYVPGDRIKDIHWKLSAKRDEVYIRERESMAQDSIKLYLDLYKVVYDKETQRKKFTDNALLSKKLSGTNQCGYHFLPDEILMLAISFIRKMLEKNQPVEIIWRNQKEVCYQRFLIEEEKQIREGFYLIFESEMAEEKEECKLQYQKDHKLSYVCCKYTQGMEHVVLKGKENAVIVKEG